jgi:hypothetical protein
MVPLSRRRFIARSACATIAASAGWRLPPLGLLSTGSLLAAEAPADSAKPLNVCLVSGSLEYRSDESLAAFQEYLEKRYPVHCTRAFMKTEEDFEPFVSAGSLYRNPKLATDVTTILRGTIPEHTEPVAWTRVHRGGRVFYTSLGHPDDFRQASFVRLLTHALFWTTHRQSATQRFSALSYSRGIQCPSG